MSEPSVPVRAAIVGRQEVVTRGLTAMLADYPDRVVITALPSVRSKAAGVDVILYDAYGLLLNEDGSELDHLLTETDAKILLLSRDLRPDLRVRAMAKGCTAWVSLSIHEQELVDAIEKTAAGEPVPEPQSPLGAVAGLTPRETEVIALITLGLPNTDIAAKLFMSENTLKSHIRTAYRKIGAASRSQAVAWAIQHGFAPPD